VADDGQLRPLVVVDLALRHDVDPSVAELPGVHLITLDTVARLAPDRHAQPVEEAMRIVVTAVDEFMAEQRGRERSAEVVAARDRALAVAEAEIAHRLGVEVSSSDRELRALRRAARAAVHGPTVRAHAAARTGDVRAYEQALDELRSFATGAVGLFDRSGAPDVVAR
jgi:glutamyl-tRNA reductase